MNIKFLAVDVVSSSKEQKKFQNLMVLPISKKNRNLWIKNVI